MAARAIAELDSVESIDVSAASRDLDPPPGLSLPYALETLIDELTLPPVVLRDGEPAEVEPLSDGGEVDFGEQIGVAGTIYTLHSELRTFGESFGCRAVQLPAVALAAAAGAAARADRRRAGGGARGRSGGGPASPHRRSRFTSSTPPGAGAR